MSKYDELMQIGNAKYDQGDYQEALNLYREASELEPNNPDVWISLGNTEQWTQKFSHETSKAIERSYKDYAHAVDVASIEERLRVNKEIFNGLIKQSNILAGSILKCQNSRDSFYRIDEMVSSNRLMLTWLANFFASPKFDFRPFEEDQFDFVVSLVNLIFLNIREYYNRIPNSDPLPDLKGVKMIFTYELLPFIKTLKCYRRKKLEIVNGIRNEIDNIRDEIERLSDEKYMLEEEKTQGDVKDDLEKLKQEKKKFKFIKDSKMRTKLKLQIEKMQDKMMKSERKYTREINRLELKISHLERRIEYLQRSINERMSLFM